MSMHRSLRPPKPVAESKAHRVQARSAPRKRARQKANAEWHKAEAARLGMTMFQYFAHCAREIAAMGAPRRIVVETSSAYYDEPRFNRPSYDDGYRPLWARY